MNPTRREDVRNIAIIAHVDHGKTTLVDGLLRQTGSFQVKADEAQEQVLDSNELERERGITILAKCTSVPYRNATINIVDTPGHADFGSEVERILRMVDGCLLLVDAQDGPMPQTRFVLRKSLALGLAPIVVINKMDRPNAKPSAALDAVFSHFIDLGATDPQLDFPIVYAAGKQGWASLDMNAPGKDLTPLFETILGHVPAPVADPGKPFQMQVTMLDRSNYLGKIAIGRVYNGKVSRHAQVALIKQEGKAGAFKVTQLLRHFGLERREVVEAQAGDIIGIAGIESADVGDTIADPERPEYLPPLVIDEPTMSMEISVNNSPFAGKEGKFVTSRHLRERLLKEKAINVGLRIEELPGEGNFRVSGRGELHLAILIETMRREGYELSVARPEVIDKVIDGVKHEPAEHLVVDIETQYQGAVLESMGRRGARMLKMETEGTGRLRLEYVIPARALMGFKSELLTNTKGTGLMHHSFYGYEPRAAEPPRRPNGVLIAKELGLSTGYALDALQERAVFFIGPGVQVYEGMIVGQNSRPNDLVVNPCKAKQLTNMRTKATDDAIQLSPPRLFSLEQAIEYVERDELVEVTPKSIRLRKKILEKSRRKRADRDEEPESFD
ncbi:MAG: translational GTPase TypA [Elusimicrobia bacterium]|nr:translational GTPase TypA [Elusimicrobiota bacterium]